MDQKTLTKALDVGTRLVANEEGFRAKAYRNHPKEPWTIGFGFTYDEAGNPIKPGDVWTRERATAFLRKQIPARANKILALVKVPITANQLAAMISLQFNIGEAGFKRSTVLRKLNEGQYQAAADAFLMWRRGNTPNDLLPRRKRERALFMTV